MKVAIIGSGLQASRRGQVIHDSEVDVLVGIYSDNQVTSGALARRFNCLVFSSVDELFSREDIDVVLVCTPPDSHFKYSRIALESGKHVLVEKPFTQSIQQSRELLEIAKISKNILRCGFNHRFHPAIQELKHLILNDELGPIKFSRSLYGIGLRDDFQTEWRANQLIAAGGQFMEQGSHLVDLTQFLIGDVKSVFMKPMNFVIPKNNGEDSGFAIMTHENGAISSVTSTLLQWHNRFSIEIFGEFGFGIIEGLGGSYGVETLKIGKNIPGKPFTSTILEFRGGDKSWTKEWEAFKLSCEGNSTDCSTAYEAHKIMNIITLGYESDLKKIEMHI